MLLLARQMVGDFGCVGVVVDAKVEAIPFYERLGILRLEVIAGELGDRPQPLPMFLAIGQVRDAP